MDINMFNSRMVHDGKRNNREVEITCDYCGEKSWQRWQRVKKKLERGEHFFCSRECTNIWQREQSNLNCGYENAKLFFDKSRNTWYAHWYENGKQKSTTGAKWLWETNYGEVPDGYVVTYKDRNSENCVLENLELVTRGERTSEALIGHDVSLETRKKISKAHTGKPKWEGFATVSNYPGLSKRRKLEVKQRDNFECKICGKYLKNSWRARVHHIDGDKTNQEYDNLILVCLSCHALIHSQKRVPEEILAFRSMLKY